MTFDEWWDHGCRAGEKEPHYFASDCASDAWLAKEAWQAALSAQGEAVECPMFMSGHICMAGLENEAGCERCGRFTCRIIRPVPDAGKEA